MASVQILLKRALTHIPQYGFTRHALALSNVNTNPLSASSQPSAPLSDAAVTALFGNGNEAPKTLIRAWLAEGRANMIRNENALKVASSPERESQPSILTMEEVLLRRLEWNEPVLHHLKDVRHPRPYLLKVVSDENYTHLPIYLGICTSRCTISTFSTYPEHTNCCGARLRYRKRRVLCCLTGTEWTS